MFFSSAKTFLLLLYVYGNFNTWEAALRQVYTFVMKLPKYGNITSTSSQNFQLIQNEGYALEQRLIKRWFCQKTLLNTAIYFYIFGDIYTDSTLPI